MSFKEKYLFIQNKINEELRKFFESELKKVDSFPFNYAKDLLKAMEDFTLRGGKRLRPLLFITSYFGAGGGREEIYKVSCSIELAESFLLVHDDIMDKDIIRRGGETLHIYAQKWFKNNFGEKDKEHCGLSLGILGGDLFSNYSFKPLLSSNFPSNLKLLALEIFIENLEKCYWGQFYDILTTKMDIENVKEDDYLFLVEHKTASYTTVMPLLMGSIFAGKKGEYLEQMKKFGKYLGIAFQIKDDILGVFGDVDKMGKSNLSDLKEGKKTLLVIKAYEKGEEREKDFLKEKLGSGILQEEDLMKFREIFEKTGALEYAEEKAREYIQKAKIVFEKIPFKEEWKDFLNDLMNYIIEREK